jgi:hypothetical protein
VLTSGRQLALFTTALAQRGTPAAPEPLASRGRYYEDDQLAELARRAGFAEVAVTNDPGQLLTALA